MQLHQFTNPLSTCVLALDSSLIGIRDVIINSATYFIEKSKRHLDPKIWVTNSPDVTEVLIHDKFVFPDK